MAFQFKNSDGEIEEDIYACTECIWLSTKKHAHKKDGKMFCVLCNSPCEKVRTVTTQTGMTNFEYKQLLTYLEENVSGVGSGTRLSLEDEFDNGDEFIESAEDAYQSGKYNAITAAKGVGASTAERIVLALAEREGWEDGQADKKFTF